MDPLLHPTTLQTAATVDDASEIVERLLSTTDPDLLADLMEHAVDKSDRAHAVIYLLVCRVRGWTPAGSGVEMVAEAPHPSALILPPGVR